MSSPTTANKPTSRRRKPLLWVSGLAASIVLVLAVTGTLSTWTRAIITNGDNSAGSTAAVALVETQVAPPGNTTVCDTGTSSDNTATCAGVNTYGGVDTPLDPDSLSGGNSQSVTVELKNDGTASGGLTLEAGACDNQALVGSTGTDLVGYDLCTQMLLDVTCTDPAGGMAPDLAIYSGTVDGFTTAGPGRVIATLGATESTRCTFTVTLPPTTPSGYASQSVNQSLTWKLDA